MPASKYLTQARLTAALLLDSTDATSSAWLFGSRAAGCATPASDWDILLLTPRASGFERRCTGALDVVTVGWAYSQSDVWLASELAAHVACYGHLLIGSQDWIEALDTVEAYRRKAARTRARIAAVDRAWVNLSPYHRVRRARALRRDVQRALSLKDQGTVPPTFLLDKAWATADHWDRVRTIDRLDIAVSDDLVRMLRTAHSMTHERAKSVKRRDQGCRQPGLRPRQP